MDGSAVYSLSCLANVRVVVTIMNLWMMDDQSINIDKGRDEFH
jgi:hypothetical protein